MIGPIDKGTAMSHLAVTIYAMVAAGFILATYLEGEQRGGGWGIARIAGLLLSAAWPLAIILVVVLTRNTEVKRSMARGTSSPP